MRHFFFCCSFANRFDILKKNGRELAMKKVYEGNLVEVFEIVPNVFFRSANLPIRDQCNGAYFVGEHGVCAVDAPPEGIEMVEEAKEIFQKPIQYLFLTHGDGDHVNGLDDFLDMDITVFCSRRLLDTLKPQIAGKKASLVGVEGRMPLQFSGMEMELFTLPDITHSRWDMFIKLPKEGILCTGDAVVEYETAFYHGAEIDTWISSLRKLAKEDGKLILAGHADGPYDYTYIDQFADHMEAIRSAAQQCYDAHNAGMSDDDRVRFKEICAADVEALVDRYFEAGSDEAKGILARSKEESKRQVRMVLWALIRRPMR